ncbi:TatD family hydrolase [Providencia sp. 21OH12SH02B-Prov]|uniref:TatD family hydrolase n=1 Tax=Providencia TaxID=586 RepID=UPI001FF578EB|nr:MULTISPECIES: TatD family hydrolase [Providencia]ELZ5939585.1 TatD family hydrolase [Providencia stuartii]MCK1142552.1 TatD family hydrolase [Providencia stuartii]WBA56531.1 TatD family hydrolase [Providencia sp. 21OH12SH02B-Prov]
MTNRFIDTHCHFDFPPFVGAIDESLCLAEKAGVTDIIIPAVSVDNFERVWHLAQRYSQLHAAIGFHPLYLNLFQEQHMETMIGYLHQNHAKCVAVGEIGLDLYMQEPLFDLQQQVLIAQLKLAKQFDLPVILHSRKSHDPLAALLRRYPVPACGVIHGFAGSLSQAQAFIKLGYFIGVGGTITYERANKTRQAIAKLPLTSLVFETDAPDMPVSGFQGEPNRPERIQQIFQSLCELRHESPDEIAQQLYINSLSLFNLFK